MLALMALTGHEIDRDIAAAAARVLDPKRDQIVAVHVVHPREVQSTVNTGRLAVMDISLSSSVRASGQRPEPSFAEDSGQAVQRLEDEMRDHIEELKQDFLSDFSVEFDVIIEKDPADAIVEAAEQRAAGGIVMGTRGKRSRFSSALLGSCAADVVRRSDAPVLIVKEGTVAGVTAP